MIFTAEADGIRMQYLEFGHGEKTLVILPGLSVKSVLLYEEAIVPAYSVFAGEYTVRLFDRRLDVPDGYGIADMAADTAAVMKSLGISDACVFGVSQGGMIAQLLAASHPELVKKLVLASTSSRMPDGLPFGGGSAGDRADKFMKALYSDGFARAAGLSVITPDLTRKELARFDILSKAADGFDATEALRLIKCPSLVICASDDAMIPASESVRIANGLGCGLYVYGPPYGHAVYDEAPDFKNRVYEFLQRDK